ncbi:hypothetical protein KSF73_00770 [Burkholderiaceae bacterium DAT-1]|nr:hypothetical protein [Burkholderiaceae bacterium DAT-1]
MKLSSLFASLIAATAISSPALAQSVAARFTPANAAPGQSVTFSYQASVAVTGASITCTIEGVPGFNGIISGPSRSYTFQASNSLNATVTCTDHIGGGNDTGSAQASLTVGPQVPAFSYYASPSVLSAGPDYTTLYLTNAQNSNSCSGTIGQVYVARTTTYSASCTGDGGTTTRVATVTVKSSTCPKPNLCNLPLLNPSSKLALNLYSLGIQAASPSISHHQLSLSGIGAKDLIVVDAVRREAYVLLERDGAYTKIDHKIPNVSDISQIHSVFIPSNRNKAIEVDVQR